MVEHVSIQDADRHEVKHASSAALNQVLHSNGDGTTTFKKVTYSDLIGVPTPQGYAHVLSGFSSAASQSPAVVDVAKQIEFGAGVVTDDVTLSPLGVLTFHTAGDYYISLFTRQGRTGGAGTAIVFSRLLVNGVQTLNSSCVKLPDNDSLIPFTASLVISATVGMTFSLEIMRDSGGINNGGLFRTLPTTLGWNLAPSASIVVSKYVGVAI